MTSVLSATNQRCPVLTVSTRQYLTLGGTTNETGSRRWCQCSTRTSHETGSDQPGNSSNDLWRQWHTALKPRDAHEHNMQAPSRYTACHSGRTVEFLGPPTTDRQQAFCAVAATGPTANQLITSRKHQSFRKKLHRFFTIRHETEKRHTQTGHVFYILA